MLQAAKYYELASKLGHATAMYNLGVFYVRGWGGVQIDSNKARDLFVAAAKLGQTNAIEALAMVPAPEQESDKIGTDLLKYFINYNIVLRYFPFHVVYFINQLHQWFSYNLSLFNKYHIIKIGKVNLNNTRNR